MTLEKQISNLRSAYQHNKEAVAAIDSASHIFVSELTSLVEHHRRKQAKKPKETPALAFINQIISEYPEDFRPHLQKVVDETSESILRGIVDTCVRTAAKLPEDPKALDLPDYFEQLKDYQLEQLKPHLTGVPNQLASDLYAINTAINYELRKSTPDQALAVLKDIASGKRAFPKK